MGCVVPSSKKRGRDEIKDDEEINTSNTKAKLEGGSLSDLQNEYTAIRNKYILLKNNIQSNHNLL